MNFKELKTSFRLLKYSVLCILFVYLLICVFKYAKAKNTKKNIVKIKIGMSKEEALEVLGSPYNINKNQLFYRTNFNPLYPIRAVVGVKNGIVDTVYTLED